MQTNPVLQAIFERRSIRNFEPTPVDKETLDLILEAGIWAPSASNYQTWHFTVIQDKALIEQINEEGMQYVLKNSASFRAQQGGNPNYHVFHHAPCIILVSYETSHSWAKIDTALAAQNIMLAAHSLGLGTTYIGRLTPWLESEEAKPILSALPIPEGYAPLHFIILGKPTAEGNKRDRRPGTISYL